MASTADPAARKRACDTESHGSKDNAAPHVEPAAFPPIGDDGLYMTPARMRMHRCLNFVFVWAVITLISTAVFATVAFMQNQTYTGDVFDLRATGGNEYAGHLVADLLRLQAGYCFATGLLYMALQYFGFTWLYEKRGKTALFIVTIVIVALSFAWALYLGSIGLFEPFSLVAFATLAVLWVFARQTERETRRGGLDV